MQNCPFELTIDVDECGNKDGGEGARPRVVTLVHVCKAISCEQVTPDKGGCIVIVADAWLGSRPLRCWLRSHLGGL